RFSMARRSRTTITYPFKSVSSCPGPPHRVVHLAQWHAMFAGHAGTILVLRREHREPVAPAALALHQPPRRLDPARLPPQLAALGRRAADTERAGFAEQDRFQFRNLLRRGDHAEEHAGTVLL